MAALLGCGWPNHKTWKWKDTGKLMRYGLDHYEYRCLTDRNVLFPEEELPEITVENGIPREFNKEATVHLSSANREYVEKQGILMRPEEDITVRIVLPERIIAPVEKGEVIGEIHYLVEDSIYRSEEIVADESVFLIDFRWCIGIITQFFLI